MENQVPNAGNDPNATPQNGTPSNAAPTNGANGTPPPPSNGTGPDDLPILKNADGTEVIPKDAFEKRLGAEVAKRKALEDQLNQFKNGQGTPQNGAQPAPANTASPYAAYETWASQALGGDAQSRQFFDGFFKAIVGVIDPAIVAYVDEVVKPFGEWRQQSESERFFGSNKEAEALKADIDAVRQKYPGMSYDEAWRLVKPIQSAPRNHPAPPPATGPRAPGAPANGNQAPKGQGIGAIVSHVLDQKGL